VGGGHAGVLLVRDGRGELASRPVRVLHILLETFGAPPVVGPCARAGAPPLGPGVRHRRTAPVSELFVDVPTAAQSFRHRLGQR